MQRIELLSWDVTNFLFHFLKLLFLHLLFPTSQHLTLSPGPEKDYSLLAPQGHAPGPTCGCSGSPYPLTLASLVTLDKHKAICKAWAEMLLPLRASRRDWSAGLAMPQNLPVLLQSPWACSAAMARLRKLSSDGSGEKGNCGKVF